MAERGLIFSGESVRGILANAKTQTRRLQGLNVINQAPDAFPLLAFKDGIAEFGGTSVSLRLKCPFRLGEHRYVKETFRWPAQCDNYAAADIVRECILADFPKPWCPTQYEADGSRLYWGDTGRGSFVKDAGRLRSPLFLPRWAARIWIEITDVRIQRLQDISEDDARAEGFERHAAFFEGWQRINGKRAPLKLNPWVWPITFRRVERQMPGEGEQ